MSQQQWAQHRHRGCRITDTRRCHAPGPATHSYNFLASATNGTNEVRAETRRTIFPQTTETGFFSVGRKQPRLEDGRPPPIWLIWRTAEAEKTWHNPVMQKKSSVVNQPCCVCVFFCWLSKLVRGEKKMSRLSFGAISVCVCEWESVSEKWKGSWEDERAVSRRAANLLFLFLWRWCFQVETSKTCKKWKLKD